MLELWQAEGAFAQIEDYLRGEGFFGPDARGLVADLFLGYGLSQTIRRTSAPVPPEPCPLPLVACRIHSLQETPRAAGDFRVGEWTRTWTTRTTERPWKPSKTPSLAGMSTR